MDLLFCGSHKFFSSTLNGLATALANLPTAPWDKVKQLFSFCPQLSSQPCVLTERELAGVTALGLFAIKTRLSQFGDHIVTYLLKLLESLPQAKWTEPTDATIRHHGPLAEHFAQRVTLILVALATLSDEIRAKVGSVLSVVLEEYATAMADVQTLEADVVCGELLPAVIGVVWALRCTPRERVDKLRTIFSLSFEDAGQLQLSFKEFIRLRGHRLVNIPQDKTEEKEDFLTPFACRVSFSEKCVMTLYRTATRVLEGQLLLELEQKVTQYNQSSPLIPCLYRGVKHFLQYVFFSALQQVVVTSKLDNALSKEIHKEAEQHLKRCGRELGQMESHNYSGACDQMYLLTRILGPLAIIYAWTANSQSDAEEGFRRLSALLRAFTGKPIVIVTSFRIAILDSFVTLSLNYPKLTGSVLRELKEFMCSSLFLSLHSEAEESWKRRSSITSELAQDVSEGSVVHRHEVFEELQDAFKNALCLVLDLGQKENSDFIPAFLANMVHQLSTPGSTPENKQFKECAVIVLEHVMVQLKHHPRIPELVIGYYHQQLFRTGTELSLDKMMLQSLGRIAVATADEQVLSTIYKLMDASLGNQQMSYPHGVSSQEALGPAGKGYTGLATAVIEVLNFIAGGLKDWVCLEELAERLFSLLVAQGQGSFRASQKADSTIPFKATATSFNAGLLLQPLSIAFRRIPSLRKPNIRLYRDFWLYSVVLGLSTTHAVFPPEWRNHLKSIAAKSPNLLSDGADHYFQLDLELSFVADIGSSQPKILQEVQQVLQELTNSALATEQTATQFSFVQCIFLTSLYHLEQMRLKAMPSSFPSIFLYLEDKGLQQDSSVWAVLRSIVSKLLGEYIEFVKAEPLDRERSSLLEQFACVLVEKLAHLHEAVRRVASASLTTLTEAFPFLLTSPKVVTCLLDQMEQCSGSVSLMEMKGDRGGRCARMACSIVQLETSQEREVALGQLARETKRFLRQAKEWSSQEAKATLQHYLSRTDKCLSGFHGNPSVGLSLEELVLKMELNHAYKHFETPPDLPGFMLRHGDEVAANLQLRAKYLGEIHGMTLVQSLLAQDSKTNTEGKSSSAELAQLLSKEIVTALKSDNVDKCGEALLRGTALIISSKELHRKLLYDVCVRPVRSLKQKVVVVAVHCWQWLLTARRELAYEVLTHFATVWRWTVDNRHGLFSQQGFTGDAAAVSSPSAPPKLDIHRTLLQFFHNRLQLSLSQSEGETRVLIDLLHYSLPLLPGPTEQHMLSVNMAAVGLRFSLLRAALDVLTSGLVEDSTEHKLLCQRMYAAAFDHFCFDPMWPSQSETELREDISHLIGFFSDLKKLPDGNGREASSAVSSGPVFWDTIPGDSALTSVTWLNTLSIARKASSLSLGSSSSKLSRTGSFTSKTSKEDKTLCQVNRKTLLLTLMQQEIDRLLTWSNPQSMPQLRLKAEESVTQWVCPFSSEKHWKLAVLKALQESPHLAVQLKERFPGNEAVAKEVTSFVQLQPMIYVTIPKALQLFATPEVVEDNNAELLRVLYWKQVPIDVALYFLAPPFQHHLVANLATKTLKLVKPDHLLLVIPQLVQALRHDTLGFIKGFILWANVNPILTHQFVWSMNANMFLDEEGKEKDDVLGDLLESIIAQIESTLTGEHKEFMEREFSFFKEITGISGKIRDFPKGPERKKACREALQQVSLVPGVYLPANPDSVISEIDKHSGTPMQSAAKAPFRARFKVRHCGLDEVVKINRGKNQLMRQHSIRTSPLDQWKAYIFKVGDDVRQDMLALQIMSLMADVFAEVGIPLYLKPYRVVATGPGRGVIECVPDTSSRDELGKQTSSSLKQYYHSVYGEEDSPAFQKARANFVCSMAGYSLVSYLLQIKDRHNGNIMIDKHGYIIHIDFGFLFESSPGGNLGFEPDFKLTEEMLELMGGKSSPNYRWFNDLFTRGYLALRPHMDEIVTLVQLMLESKFPCFRGQTIPQLKSRFNPSLSERDAAKFALSVVERACLSIRARGYDLIQDVQQGIYYTKNIDNS